MGMLTKLVVGTTKGVAKGTKKIIDKKTGTFKYDYCDTGEMVPPELYSEVFVQDSMGNITFKNSSNVYRATGYWWAGPNFQEYAETEVHGVKRTALMTGGGALLGLSCDDSFGALVGGLVGRMMSGGAREKVKIKKKENKTPAVLILKNVFTGEEHKLGFLCDKALNDRITGEIQFGTV